MIDPVLTNYNMLKLISETLKLKFGEAHDALIFNKLALNEAGIDDLERLDLFFAINKKYKVKLPVSEWEKQMQEGSLDSRGLKPFTLASILAEIDAQEDQRIARLVAEAS